MLLNHKKTYHLTYCSNIFKGTNWPNTLLNLKKYMLGLKKKLTKNSFGLSLCISNSTAKELIYDNNLFLFNKWIKKNKLYLSSINGFVYQTFHQKSIKEKIYNPEWTSNKRINYTCNLIKILTTLLPKKFDGSISTSPISYKPWVKKHNKTYIFYKSSINFSLLILKLIHLHKYSKKLIHIDIEPEPTCFIETAIDIVFFFNNWLLPIATNHLKKMLNISTNKAKTYIKNHIRICYDTCHFSIKFKNHRKEINKIKKEHIKIGKIQISSGLTITLPKDKFHKKLIIQKLLLLKTSPFLHQLIEKNKTFITTYKDFVLPIKNIAYKTSRKWRIHCHVPIYLKKYTCFNTTQKYTQQLISLLTKYNITKHIEIETYTYNILSLKTHITTSILNEYTWFLTEFSKNLHKN